MRSFFKKHLWLILSLVVATWAGRFLLTSHHFYTHDDMQVFRVNEYVNCLRDGAFPCRWASNLGKGFGYPLFNYYPPLIYLIPSLLHLADLPIVTSLNLFMFGSFVIAGWGMYLLFVALTKNPRLGFLASILYTLYPFHAVNVFVRGVYAENLAWSLFPFLLYLIFDQSRLKRFGKITPLVLAAVYLTHLIGGIIITGLVLLSAIVCRNAKTVLIQVLVALGVSAFFLLPALAEKHLVQTESMISGYYAFTNHYVSSYQLFGQYRWSYDASLWSAAPDEMPYMVGHVHTILLVLLIFTVIYLSLRYRSFLSRHSKKIILSGGSLTIALFLLFLAHFKSDFIWQLLPPLAYVQFPWRFIAWAALPLILTIILLISLLPKKWTLPLIIIISTLILVYSSPFFRPREYDGLSDDDIIFGRERTEQQVKSFYDYLPYTVRSVPPEYAFYPSTSSRSTNYYHDTISLSSPSNISFPVFYFPGWTARVNNDIVVIPPPPDSGLITLPLSPGNNDVTLVFGNTPLRRFANIVSLIALVLYLLYAILKPYEKSKKS